MIRYFVTLVFKKLHIHIEFLLEQSQPFQIGAINFDWSLNISPYKGVFQCSTEKVIGTREERNTDI